MKEALVIDIRDFTGGRNTTVSEPRLGENESPNELNVRSRPVGVLARRDGWQRYDPVPFGDYPSAPTGLYKLYRSRDTGHVLYVYVGTSLWARHEDGSHVLVKGDFQGNTYCEFATMKDMAYGTNFKDLPFRAWAGEVENAELPVPLVPHYYFQYTSLLPIGYFIENPTGLDILVSVTGPPSKRGRGGHAYRFRAYFGKDLGESGWGVSPIAGQRGGVGSPMWWETCWYVETSAWGPPPFPTTTAIMDLGTGSPALTLPFGAESLRIYRTQSLVDISGPNFSQADLEAIAMERPSREQILNAPYYFLDEIKAADVATTVYRDVKSDDDLEELASQNPIFHQYAKFVEEHNDRLFYAGINERWLERATTKEIDNDGSSLTYGTDSLHPTMVGTMSWRMTGPVAHNRLYMTFPYEPSRMEGFIDVRPEDGDEITAIKSLGPLLVIFKKRRIYTLLGVSFQDFVIRLAESAVGCIAPRSVAKHGDALIFYSGTDVYRFDGASATPIGTKVRLELQAIDPALKPLAAGVVYRDTYLLSVSEDI